MRHCVVAIVLVAACHGDGAKVPDESRHAVAVASTPAGSADAVKERLAALQACGDAFGEIARGSAFSDAISIYARGCKDLYREPACHGAIESLAGVEPEARLVAVATACASAYCKKLPPPAPTLCTSDARQATATDWKELDAHILAYELGGDPDSAPIQAVAGAMFREIVVRAPDRSVREAPRAQLQVTISVSGAQAVVGIVGGKQWSVSSAPAGADLAPLIAALQKASNHADVQIVLAAGRDTPHGTVIAVMNALRDAGFTKLALAGGGAP
jgi:biopolymer transport protein ExbD